MGKIINVHGLKVGMILAKDVVDKNTGVVLISKNIALTRTLINNLIKSGVHIVKVKDEKIQENLINQNFMESYSNVEKSLDNIFHVAKEEGRIDTEGLIDELKLFVNEVIEVKNISTQMELLKTKDDYTFDHSLGVSVLAVALGKWLGYSKDNIVELSIVGLLHDIGKLKVPEEIVNKPGKLSEEEFKIMKKHSEYSYEMILETGEFNEDILLGVLQHHEKLNGTGYPNGLKKEDIHEYAKIIAVCDIYHALTSDRVYKYRDSPLNVADYIRKESFESLDPEIVGVFLKNMSKFYVGAKVLLSNGSIGNIIYIHPQNKTKPIVKVGEEFIDFLNEDTLEIVDVII